MSTPYQRQSFAGLYLKESNGIIELERHEKNSGNRFHLSIKGKDIYYFEGGPMGSLSSNTLDSLYLGINVGSKEKEEYIKDLILKNITKGAAKLAAALNKDTKVKGSDWAPAKD